MRVIVKSCHKVGLQGGESMLIYLSMIETEEDKSKFVQLYETYKNLMFYVSNRILNDEYLAEDAVHQTFIKIIENLDKIKEVRCHKTKSYIVTMGVLQNIFPIRECRTLSGMMTFMYIRFPPHWIKKLSLKWRKV